MDAIMGSHEIQELYVLDKFERQASYAQLRCLVAQILHVLSEDRHILDFKLPTDMELRPLELHEERLHRDGVIVIKDTRTSDEVVVFPLDALLRRYNTWTNVTDRGPTIAAPLWFLTFTN